MNEFYQQTGAAVVVLGISVLAQLYFTVYKLYWILQFTKKAKAIRTSLSLSASL